MTCEDCGCKKYNGFCTNCDEEVFIMEQYDDLLGTEYEVPHPDKDSDFMKRYNNSMEKKNGK